MVLGFGHPNTAGGGHLRRVGMLGGIWRRVAVVLAAAVAFAGAPLAGGAASAHPASVIVDSRVTSATTPTVDVIVQKLAGAGDGPEQAIADLGGTVTRDLSIIDGF